MSKPNVIYNYFLSRIQIIEFNESGIIVYSDDLLFKAIKGTFLHEIHPFFEIINDLLATPNEEIHFETIQLELSNQIIIADILINTGDKKNNPTILIFDNSKSYDLVQEITQQKNEVFISDYIKSQKLIENNREKALKNKFLAEITNDLKIPISSVYGLLELFQRSNLTFDQVALLDIIRTSMSHLNRLVSDVLELTKSEMGILNIEINSFDFDELVLSIEKIYEKKFFEKNLAFELIKSDRIPKYLIGDRDRLMQIIETLLENAYITTKKGEVLFEIKIDNISPGKIGLSFIIKDTGIGFNEQQINNFFNNYKDSNEIEKFGLGLSIVGNLIKLLHGSIKVESKINKGSTFRVFLPFSIEIIKERNHKNSSPSLKKIDFEKKLNVLIVDDKELNQLILMKLLINHKGFFIDIANEPKLALDMISKDTYDIIFIDLNMKENNGFKTIELIRNSKNKEIKKLPIIPISSYDSESERKLCKSLKVNNYLIKPYSNNELFENIYKISNLI